MITALLRRVRDMPHDERAFRTRTALHTHAQRVGVIVRGSIWDRRRIAGVLTPTVRASMAAPIERGDWAEVEAHLLRHLRGRPQRFVLNPGRVLELRAEITARWPDAARRAASAADEVAAGRYALLGFEALSFARGRDPVDWHFDPVHDRRAPRAFWADVPYLDAACGDHKIIWELNRHQHFLALGRALWLTGDARYGDAILSDLRSWLAANPPLIGVNWASMLELGLRSLSWLWAMHFLLADAGTLAPRAHGDRRPEPWLIDLIVALDRQLAHVERNLSYYFSPNTHLTGEALALYVAGIALPELARSAQWAALGRRILLTEIASQIGVDGGHVERSTQYHRYTLDFYLLALLTAERAGDDEAASAFGGAVDRLAAFMGAMTSDAGRIPLIGDDDGGLLWPIAARDPSDVRDSMALAGVLRGRPDLARWGIPEETLWIAWDARSTEIREHETADPVRAEEGVLHVSTRSLQATGFVVIRDGGSRLVFDVGPHGFLNGGHAHADALAITLDVGGHPLLIDPGTATYTMDRPLRDRMRGSASHNTVTLDGRSSAVPAGPFHWHSKADARLEALRHNPGFGWAEGSHDGYDPVRHRRSIVRGAGQGWLIVDEIVGGGPHLAQTHWHFDPEWNVTSSGTDGLLATRTGFPDMWLVHDGGELILARGDDATGLGWCSPRYGRLTSTWAARRTSTVGSPAMLVTWIGADGGTERPSLHRLQVDADSSAGAVAVRIRHHAATIVTLLRPGDDADRDTRSTDGPDYHTNARMLQYAIDGAGGLQLSVADVTHVLALHDPLISLGADDRIRDLHVSLRGDCLDLWSTSPPSLLYVRSAAAAAVRHARLNGRERPIQTPPRADTITFDSSDWGDSHPPPESHRPASVTRLASGRRTERHSGRRLVIGSRQAGPQ